jgi:hypothetical protein
MYKHNPTTPDWLYRPANISKEKVQIFSKELYTLYTVTQKKNTNIPPNTTCFMIVPDFRKFDLLCPKLNYFLSKEWGIRDYVLYMAFICLSSDLPMSAHIDGLKIDIALNMPVQNCHDSFTVWHNVYPEKKEMLSGYNNYDGPNGIVSEDPAWDCGPTSELTEIGRCPVSEPHWVNISVPHNPISNHSQFRINASFRFNYKLVDPNNLPNNFYVA